MSEGSHTKTIVFPYSAGNLLQECRYKSEKKMLLPCVLNESMWNYSLYIKVQY